MTDTTTPPFNPINQAKLLQWLTPSDLTPAQIQTRETLINTLLATVIASPLAIADGIAALTITARELEDRAEELFAAYEQQQFAAWEAQQIAGTPPSTN